MKDGEVIVVKATVNSAKDEKEFLGYITEIIRRGKFYLISNKCSG